MKEKIKLLFTGGGSGGHAMPAFSMIEAIKEFCEKNGIKYDILYIGSKNGVEENIARRYGVNYKRISTGKLRRYFSIKNFTDIFRILFGLIKSFFIIGKFKPDVIFSTGGFVSIPPVIAGKLRKKKVIIHEQTIDAGLANKIAARFADKICVTFSESKKYFLADKTEVTGIPLRKEIFSGTNESALKRFGFDKNLPTVFFFGGGLGCRLINDTAPQILPVLLEKCNIIFQTGRSDEGRDHKKMKNFYESLPVDKKKRMILFDFINEEIGDIYSIATLAIARSGAGTVCEFMKMKLPAIFIPLAIATGNEQYQNALILKNAGCAVIIEEKNFNGDLLLKSIEDILFGGKINDMKENFKNISDPDGKEKLLEIILSFDK